MTIYDYASVVNIIGECPIKLSYSETIEFEVNNENVLIGFKYNDYYQSSFCYYDSDIEIFANWLKESCDKLKEHDKRKYPND